MALCDVPCAVSQISGAILKPAEVVERFDSQMSLLNASLRESMLLPTEHEPTEERVGPSESRRHPRLTVLAPCDLDAFAHPLLLAC